MFISTVLGNEFLHRTVSLLLWLPALLVLLTGIIIVSVTLFRSLDYYHIFKKQYIFLEINPPANTDKTPYATEQLFSIIHGMEARRTPVNKLLRRRVVLSLEVVSSRKEGIRYLLRIPKKDKSNIDRNISSYLPNARIKVVKDYLPTVLNARNSNVLNIKQVGHFAYPLMNHVSLAQHDPVAYLTGAMIRLKPDELMAFQVVLTPAIVPEANRISKRLHRGRDIHNSIS